MNRFPWCAVVTGTIIMLACAAEAGAQMLRTTSLGGRAGGLPNQAFCNDNEELAGIYGNAGWYVDSVGLSCVRINRSNGTWQGETRTGQRLGGGGGRPYDLRCPRDHVVMGFRGRGAMLLDRLEIECRRLGADGRVSGSSVWRGTAGGTGGNSFGPHRCPGNRPAFGFIVYSGIYVDGLILACRP